MNRAEASEPVTRSRKKITNSIGMKFAHIAPGTFMMGSPTHESDRDEDEQQHRVTLTKGFYMQTTEVTQGQWMKVMGSNPSRLNDCGDNCPVEMVSWHDAQEFIRELNRREGANSYRLPSEAEWEYAARAGSATKYSWGNTIDCSKAMYENAFSSPENHCIDFVGKRGQKTDSTSPVQSYSSNLWGLYDMHGNVWEWCHDWYGEYPSGSVADPKGPSNSSVRIFRGGSWLSEPRNLRSARRAYSPADDHSDYLGFRLLRKKDWKSNRF